MNPREHYLTRLAGGYGLTMFGHGPCDGLPTISTMSALAKDIGAEVHHLGFGCFRADAVPADKAFTRAEAFGFCGGGALSVIGIEPDTFSWAPLSVTQAFKPRVLKALRALLPGLPVTRDEARKALKEASPCEFCSKVMAGGEPGAEEPKS